jgi:hypothetical protein
VKSVEKWNEQALYSSDKNAPGQQKLELLNGLGRAKTFAEKWNEESKYWDYRGFGAK